MSRWHVVPEEWKSRLRTYLRATCGEVRDRLLTHDFRSDQSVHLTFDDGSFALFRYAFAVLNEAGEQCMVFTEHCGYHVFPVGAGGVQVVRSVPLDGVQDAEPGAAADGGG